MFCHAPPLPGVYVLLVSGISTGLPPAPESRRRPPTKPPLHLLQFTTVPPAQGSLGLSAGANPSLAKHASLRHRAFLHRREATGRPRDRRSEITIENQVPAHLPEVRCRIRRRPDDRCYVCNAAIPKGFGSHFRSRRLGHLRPVKTPRVAGRLQCWDILEIFASRSVKRPDHRFVQLVVEKARNSCGAYCNYCDIVAMHNLLLQIPAIFPLLFVQTASYAKCILIERHTPAFPGFEFRNGIWPARLTWRRASRFDPNTFSFILEENIGTGFWTFNRHTHPNEAYCQIHFKPALTKASGKFHCEILICKFCKSHPKTLATSSGPIRPAVYTISDSLISRGYVIATIFE